jgi:hypothetical protein
MNAYWSLLSTHGTVLWFVAAQSDVRVRQIAAETGFTERRVLQVLGDLRSAGFIHTERIGRRNHYVVPAAASFRHPAIGEVPFQTLFDALESSRGASRKNSDEVKVSSSVRITEESAAAQAMAAAGVN